MGRAVYFDSFVLPPGAGKMDKLWTQRKYPVERLRRWRSK